MRIQDRPDWAVVKQRWEAWWNHDLHDRVLVQVTAPLDSPRDDIAPQHLPAVDAETSWTNAGHMISRTLEQLRTTYYGGEALPALWHDWSAGHSLLFGCRPRFAKDTVWVQPAPVGEDGFPSFDGWRDSPWWSWMCEGTLAAARASQGRYFVMPGWGNGAGDTLALVRGTERLLVDILENPGWVREAVWQLSGILIEIYAELWELVGPNVTGVEGSLDFCGCWSPGRTMCFDCDMSYMVSPKSFGEMFLPPLVEIMRTVDRRIFHVDGIGVARHLELLLDIPELDAIQWIPGAGHEPVLQWAPLIRRVQARGKSIQVSASSAEIEPLLAEVRPEGLLISTSAASEAEARDVIALVERLH